MTPSPRQVGNALAVLLALPPAVLQVLAERIVDRLDALDAPGMDLEPDNDGEADQDDEAAPWEPGNHWPPVMGPAECAQCGWAHRLRRPGWRGAGRACIADTVRT